MVNPLTVKHKEWLARRAFSIRNESQDRESHVCWLNKDLDQVLWYWAVDGVIGDRIRRDAFAPPNAASDAFSRVCYTAAARRARSGREKETVFRDHAVPRKVLRTLIDSAQDWKTVFKILQRFCFVVYITKSEHGELPRKEMPSGWDKRPVLKRDLWARYRQAGLFNHVTVISE